MLGYHVSYILSIYTYCYDTELRDFHFDFYFDFNFINKINTSNLNNLNFKSIKDFLKD